MRIVCVMKHAGNARNFASTLEQLALRGHELRFAFQSSSGEGGEAIVEGLRSRYRDVEVERAPKPPKGRLPRAARKLRLTADYLRYLEPDYANTPKLRARAREQAPDWALRTTALPGLRAGIGPRALGRALRAIERLIPAPAATVQWLRKRRPDLLLISPLVGLGSPQADFVRAGRELGVPVVFPVHSWDNLTNKGLVRDVPDLVAVWNEPQATEAVELHGVPRDRVAVTGAPGFDTWFERRPSRDRANFAREVGVQPDPPLLLYVCSSRFIAPDEVRFVRRWLEALRAAGNSQLAGAAVVIRPHPQNAAQWSDVGLADPNAAIWPPAGANPVDEAARADFYDSLHHADAVVGINTSALIEAAIVDRPVLTVLDPDHSDTQEGTLHFRHLSEEETGVLHVAGSLPEHLEQLGSVLREDHAWRARNRSFVASFVRPAGLERAATPRLVAAIERAAEPGPPPPGRAYPRAQRLLRRALPRRPGSDRPRAVRPPPADAISQARETLRALAEDERPVIVGPWWSEVGYELLYWIPFLTQALDEHPRLAGRLTVVSRGGCQSWYQHLQAPYVELFDLLSPAELRDAIESARGHTGGYRKQMRRTPVDEEVIGRAAEAAALDDHLVLHPETMYGVYWEMRKQGSAAAHGRALFAHRPLEAPDPGALGAVLPDDYVAARFYFRPSFPETAENVAFARDALNRLLDVTEVVLLNSPVELDEHWDLEPDSSDHLIRIDELMSPRNNLGLQTDAVARARAFVGSYGGLAYLPPHLGVRSLSVYSDANRFKRHHLELAQSVFGENGFGDFDVHQVADSGLVDSLLPAV